MNRLPTTTIRFRRSAVIALCSILPLGGSLIASAVSQAAAPATTLVVSAPSQVGVGQSFTVRVSGAPAGRNVAVTVGAQTLGWAVANATGVATVTISWWSPGTITVEARIEGTGPASTANVIVGIDTPTTVVTTTTSAPTTIPVSTTTTTVGPKPGFLTTGQFVAPATGFRTQEPVGRWFLARGFAPDRTAADFETLCDGGPTVKISLLGNGLTDVCTGPDGVRIITISDRLGVYATQTLTWGASTPIPSGVLWNAGQRLSLTFGSAGLPIDPGTLTVGDATFTCSGSVCTSVDVAPDPGAQPLPFAKTGSWRSAGVSFEQEIRGTIVRGTTPSTTIPATTTTAPPTGKITVAAQYVAGNQITGAPLPFSNPSYQYLVNPSAPNRTIDDFVVTCTVNIGKSTNPNYPGYSCLTTADSLNTIVVSDARGQYAPVTLLWWSTSPSPFFLESGTRFSVDLAAKYGLAASELTNVSIEGGTCVNAVCSVAGPVYWNPSTLPPNKRPPDFFTRYRFTARGATAEAVVIATVGAKPLVAPASAVLGEPISLIWSGVAPGTYVSFRSGTSTLGWVVADGSGVATLRTALWTTGPTEVTARVGDSIFFVKASVDVVPRGSVTSTTIVGPTTTIPTVTTTTPPNPSSVVASVPANVSYGTMFTVKISGLQPSNYAEVKIADATLGWAQADSAGNASVTTSWWARGTFTVSVTEILANGTRATPVTASFAVS